MSSASLKVKGGKLINAHIKTTDGVITWIKLTGDFFLHPEEVIADIESSLLDLTPFEDEISTIIHKVLSERNAQFIGATPEDFAKVIMEASQ